MQKNLKIAILIIMSVVFGLVGCTPSSVDTMAESDSDLSEEVVEEQEEQEVDLESQVTGEEMKVHYIDVGQGDSIYIQTPNKQNILIDGGERKYGDTVIDYLTSLGVEDLDVVIGTHPHSDHIGGLVKVLEHFDAKSVYIPKVTHTTKTYEDFILAVQNQGLKFKEAKAGTNLDIEGVDAYFVGPVGDYKDHLNNWSAVLKVDHGDSSFLFTGDAELQAEADMVSSDQNIKATVLKLGHHGSDTSSSDEFLDKVDPKYGIVSAGVDNTYGHPNDEILERANNKDIEIYRTDTQGTIIASSNGADVTFDLEAETNSGADSNRVEKEQKEETEDSNETSNNELTASVDNETPSQGSNINLNVSGPSGASYIATLHYKSTDTVYEGKVGTPLKIGIGRAAKDFEVLVDIEVNDNDEIYKTKTAFTPN